MTINLTFDAPLTFFVMNGAFRRVADGLTREQADQIVERMKADGKPAHIGWYRFNPSGVPLTATRD